MTIVVTVSSRLNLVDPGGLLTRLARTVLNTALNVDYWVASPDRDHVGHVSFSSPHVDAKASILHLTDNVVFNGRWVFADLVVNDAEKEV